MSLFASSLEFFKPLVFITIHLPLVIWELIRGILEWIVPRCLYAKDVSQDIVLITGAGSGLGRGIALEFAKLGSTLILWDINQNGLDETKRLVRAEYSKITETKNSELTSDCSTYIVDVSNREAIKEAAKKVYEDLNESRKADEPERYVSVLVNNAGIYHGLMLHELSDGQIERMFKINILAHFWTVRAFLPKMIEHKRGHIVEIASMGGIGGMSKQTDYSAAKFATVGFEESLSMELAQMGLSNKVYTTVVCPFFFKSNLFTDFDDKAAAIMNSDFVARETVLTMRCNHARILLPHLTAYPVCILKQFITRRASYIFVQATGLIEGIRDIKGHALSSGKTN